MNFLRRGRGLLVGLLATLGLFPAVSSCTSSPGYGEFGKFRFVNRILGSPPLRLIPPISDIAGNVYSVNGELENFPQFTAYISYVGGGQRVLCDPQNGGSTKEDKYGLHGWVGFSEEKVFVWVGSALVELNSTGCRRILDIDPGTNTNLLFLGVMPWVYDAPSRTTITAMVKSPADKLPLLAELDVRANIFATLEAFYPGTASNVQVVGVGGDREANIGFMLIQYDDGNGSQVEGRFYDRKVSTTSITKLNVPKLPEYGVVGYLQRSKAGLVVGLLKDGKLISFDTKNYRAPYDVANGMTPVGVHRWEGELWLVGTLDGHPAIAKIKDDGIPDTPMRWEAAEKAQATLAAGNITVIDDRTLPSRTVTWDKVRTAIGDFPFLSQHSLSKHATDTTLWVISGPSVPYAGGLENTAFAIAPVGVTYP